MLSPSNRICLLALPLFCGILVLVGCSSSPAYPPLSVKGKWYTADDLRLAYRSLYFGDSTAVIDNQSDTVLNFTYRLDPQARAVLLTDMRKRTVSCRVLRATTDSLIFANLWDLSTPQRFVKE
jgi:hypothetical protein